MKTVFVGGGSLRLLSILRGALSHPQLFAGGEIFLHDLNVSRAETIGKMLKKTPEFKAMDCKVKWGANLDRGLDGADAVGMILMAGSPLSYKLGDTASHKRGFMASDNVSPNGDWLGIKGVPIAMNVARKMEKYCPNAWLMDFANPIAVLSAAVNRHTKIKAMGMCQGFTNHQSDLARIFGEDTYREDIDVDTVGINHLSFIVQGTIGGKELFAELDKVVGPKWKMPKLQPYWSAGARENITRSVTKLVDFYRRLGLLIFSTEGDGMMHMDYEDWVKADIAACSLPSRAQTVALLKKNFEKRQAADTAFAAHLDQKLDDAFWNSQPRTSLFSKSEDDIFLRALRGIAGIEKVKLVTSYLNKDNAIPNLPVDIACEFSQYLFKQELKPAGSYNVPAAAHGMISSLATHQTMLADACATEDPKLLALALQTYPIRTYSKALRDLNKELAKINNDQIPAALRSVGDYL